MTGHYATKVSQTQNFGKGVWPSFNQFVRGLDLNQKERNWATLNVLRNSQARWQKCETSRNVKVLTSPVIMWVVMKPLHLHNIWLVDELNGAEEGGEKNRCAHRWLLKLVLTTCFGQNHLPYYSKSTVHVIHTLCMGCCDRSHFGPNVWTTSVVPH